MFKTKHMDYYLFLNGKCWELRKVSENSIKKMYAGQRKQKLWQITVSLHVYICIVIGDPDPQETRVVMPLTCLTSHLCACSMSGAGFSTSCHGLFVFS